MLEGSVLSRAPGATDAMKAKRPASTEGEEEEGRARRKRLQAMVAGAEGEGAETRGLRLRLLTLLLRCAEAVAADQLPEARDLLPEIAELASPFGSSPERVAAYFGDALCARVLSSYLGAYSSLPELRPPTLAAAQSRRVAGAFHAWNALSPLVKFAHFTANQAILRALDGGGEDGVHVVDLDIMQGLQWPGLFHILASRRRRPPPRRLRRLPQAAVGVPRRRGEGRARRGAARPPPPEKRGYRGALDAPLPVRRDGVGRGRGAAAQGTAPEAGHHRGAGPRPRRRLPAPLRRGAALLLGAVRRAGRRRERGGRRRAPRRRAAAPGSGDSEHRGRGRAQADGRGARRAVERRASPRGVPARVSGRQPRHAGQAAARHVPAQGVHAGGGGLGWEDLSLLTASAWEPTDDDAVAAAARHE